jgi:hypothetical protein
MSTPAPAEPCILVCGILRHAAHDWDATSAALTERFGPVAATTDARPFTETTYYEREMGPGLLRSYLAFERLVDPGMLPDIKLATNAIEDASAEDESRTVNLDPGLVTSHSVILATCKDFSHRIYLRDGIYAEVTLMARKHRLDVLPWTYPDYRTPETIAFMEEQRQRLLAVRRGTPPAG